MLFAGKINPSSGGGKRGNSFLWSRTLQKEKKLEVCFLIFNYEFRFFFIEAANFLQ